MQSFVLPFVKPSHEIRTPMNAVLGFADLMLLDDHGLSEVNRENLQTIRNNGKLLLTLLNDILDVSRIEAGQLNLDCQPFSLRQILKTVNDTVRSIQKSRGCQDTLVLDLRDQVSSSNGGTIADCIMGDPNRLMQVFINLLSNSLKFTRFGRVEYDVKLVTNPSDNKEMLEFRVADTGCGIPPEKQEEIFNPFHQVHPSRDTHELGGTGLGLTISKKLVEMMGGEIRVESKTGEDNHGTVFWFTLPYLPAPPEAVMKMEAEGMQTIRRYSFQSCSTTSESACSSNEEAISPGLAENHGKDTNRKILVVDDNVINLKLVVRLLHRLGYEHVSTALNGEEAIEKMLSDDSIRLILLDKQMPVMGGVAAVKEIRRIEHDEQRTRMPVVALTAAAMTGDREECLAAGCDDYLTKPVSQKDLLEMLHKYIPC